MPRTQSVQSVRSEVMGAPSKIANALVASAKNYSLPNQEQRNQRLEKEAWQKLAWQWFDTIGEFRYSCNWVGNLLSKAILTVTKDGKTVTDPNDPAYQVMTELFGGPDGQSEMFRQLGLHLTVAGDSYIFCDFENASGLDSWFIAAASEVTHVSDDVWGVAGETFTNPLVIRLWRPHPVKRLRADAPTRAVLPILSEISGLTKHVAAQIDSRLASAGILFVPTEITFPKQSLVSMGTDGTTTTSDDGGSDVDAFIRMLIETANAAIANRESASALVPIVVKVPGEWVDKIQHITFWSGLDEKAIDMRKEAIGRLALGMDMPPEVLTGTSDMNHWSAWQVDESSIKMFSEPLLATIVQSLTFGFLRPSLVGVVSTDEEIARYAFGVDTSKLRLRPNRSKESIELYNLGKLSGLAMLRENGFDPEDQMKADEFKVWLATKVAGGSTTPDLVDAALRFFGVELHVEPGESGNTRTTEQEAPVIDENGNVVSPGTPMPAAAKPADAPAAPAKTTEARPTPSLKGHPQRVPPAMPSGLAASAEGIVLRALEKAGNRIKSKTKRAYPVSAGRIYQNIDMADFDMNYLLTDAYGETCERIAGRFGIDPIELEHSLDTFTRDTIRSGREFEIEDLEVHLGLTVLQLVDA